MKKLSLLATALVASTLASGATAGPVANVVAAPIDATSLTSWRGLAGTTYTAYAPLSAEQQTVELNGAISAASANKSLPNTNVALPALSAFVPSTTFGYGDVTSAPAARLSEACFTTATPVGSLTKSWAHSKTFGNSYLGGGYTTSFTLAGTAGAGSSDKISADAYAKVNGTAFGSVASIEGKAFAQLQGTTVTHNIYLKRNGTTVWTPGTTSGVLSFTKAYSGIVATGSKTIWLGPVPVNYSASASASYGINGSLSYASAALTASATPYANLTTTLTAGVNLFVASASVTGNAKVNASLPAVAKLGINTANQFKYDVDFDATYSAIGNVTGKATVYYLFGSKTWTSTLVSYSSSGTFPIVDLHGCSGVFTF